MTQRYYFLNILEELDSPGEWYLDESAGKIYFWPPEQIEGSEIKIFYTHDDLELNGNTILNESTLALFRYDEENETWIRLSSDLDWVNSTGVNTTDQILHGKAYAGYLWARTTHLSTFGIAGLPDKLHSRCQTHLGCN